MGARQEGLESGERLEDAVLLVLRTGEGAGAKGCWQHLEVGEGEEIHSPGEPLERHPARIPLSISNFQSLI